MKKLQKQVSFMESLLEAIPAPVSFKDTNHIYLGCNQAFAEFTGQPKENIIGKSVFEVAPKELAEVYRDQDEALFKNPIPQIYESSVKSGDGTTHDVMFHKATFVDSSGAVAGLIGVILDITDRKRAEELALQAARLRAVADLSSGVAHHFNNLLQIVMASTSLSLADLESGDLSEIKTNLEQMLAGSHAWS